MPFGHHIANCRCCGKTWMCGDCIPSVCLECSLAGHNGGGPFGCPICKPIWDRKMFEAQKLHEESLRDEQLRKESEFGYGILEST